MSAFADLHAEALGVVVETWGAPVTRTGKTTPFNAVIRPQNATVEGVSHRVMTAIIYHVDGQNILNERIKSGNSTWKIDGILERGRISNTYILADV